VAKKELLSDSAQEALKMWQEFCLPHHRTFMAKVEQRFKAFDAVLEVASDADRWTSKLAPGFVNHIAEQTLAALIQGQLRFRVKPRARMWEPNEYERLKAGADAHEILHTAQMEEDRFDESRRQFALQEAIAGLTVAKTFWKREKGGSPHLELKSSFPGIPPRIVEVPADPDELRFDGPVTEVVDVRDFFWHEAATELQKSPIIAHRTWMTDVEVQKAGKAGRFQNVDQLLNPGTGKSGGDENTSREEEKDARSRTRGMHEILEIWWHKPGRLLRRDDRQPEGRARRAEEEPVLALPVPVHGLRDQGEPVRHQRQVPRRTVGGSSRDALGRVEPDDRQPAARDEHDHRSGHLDR
jgi:hypothetical protein